MSFQPPAPTGPEAVRPIAPPSQNVVYVQSGNGVAVGALVCGIIGTVLGLIPILFIVAWALGITAFVLGLAGRRKAKRNPHAGRKTMATWGVVLGVASFALGCAGVAIVNDAFSDVESGLNCLAEAETAQEIEACD
ncbi:MAG: DUF4190 domain-containing protein [Actinomycetota bacterium]|nr:DUF4190 domain-containing protein [Actinomycetota bacterium]MDQ5808112.1 DUF4190 domain-containing protein [Actinomycetota bacterium]